MPSEPKWLLPEAVITINQTILNSGEEHVVLEVEKLEGALVRPQNRFYYESVYDMVSLSVTLMFSIAQAHAFLQGNKRTGYVSGLAFLADNGYTFIMPDEEIIAEVFTAVVAGETTEEVFENLIIGGVFEV